MSKYFDTATNVMVSLVCVIVFTSFIHSHCGSINRVTLVAVGDSLTINGLSVAARDHTLIVALRKDCPYCELSAGFYKRLCGAADKYPNIALVAALPQEPAAARQYLSSLGLGFAVVLHADLKRLGIPGTPSLFLVNKKGIIEKQWLGRLNTEQEAAVISMFR